TPNGTIRLLSAQAALFLTALYKKKGTCGNGRRQSPEKGEDRKMNHATRADKAALSSFRKVCFRLCQSNMDWRGLKRGVSIVHLRFLIVGIQEYDVRSLTDVISWDALTMVRELSGSPYWFYRLLAEAALRAKLDRDAPRVEVEDVRAARAAMQEMAAAS